MTQISSKSQSTLETKLSIKILLRILGIDELPISLIGHDNQKVCEQRKQCKKSKVILNLFKTKALMPILKKLVIQSNPLALQGVQSQRLFCLEESCVMKWSSHTAHKDSF